MTQRQELPHPTDRDLIVATGAVWCQPAVEGGRCGLSSGADPTSGDSPFGCYQW